MQLGNVQNGRFGPCRIGLRRLAVAAALCMTAVTAQTGNAANSPVFSSTADTVFDIIRDADPTEFVCLSYEGRAIRQMWDKRQDNEFDLNVFLFNAHFTDMPPVEIVLNPEFGSPEDARTEALRYGARLGQLPLVFRHGIRLFGVHMGDETFHAGSGKIFVYSEMTDRRISEKHLEESLMHESVHATLDAQYRLSPAWVSAQQQDDAFLTRYAASSPQREDLAETALFAYALLRHPGRIPPVDSFDILRTVPARIDVVETILNSAPSVQTPPAPPEGCR